MVHKNIENTLDCLKIDFLFNWALKCNENSFANTTIAMTYSTVLFLENLTMFKMDKKNKIRKKKT